MIRGDEAVGPGGDFAGGDLYGRGGVDGDGCEEHEEGCGGGLEDGEGIVGVVAEV